MTKDDARVNVFNRQRKVAVTTSELVDFAEDLTRRLKIEAGFSVVLVSDAAMRRYNRRFADKPYPTDVLSFPYKQEDWEEGEPYLGDILVSVETARRQSRKNLMEELKVLILHGLLHLLGFDHETDHGEMEALEEGLKKEYLLQ